MWEEFGPVLTAVTALVVATTALLALGVPSVQSWLQEKRTRRAARRDAIEQHLFFILQNYQSEAAVITRKMDEYWDHGVRIREGTAKEPLRKDWYLETVPGFRANLLRLKTLSSRYEIGDAGFFEAVEKYIYSYKRQEEPKTAEEMRALLVNVEEQIGKIAERAKKVESAAVTFLANIATAKLPGP